MKKSDLKTGMILVGSDGSEAMVLLGTARGDIYSGKGAGGRLDNVNEDLTSEYGGLTFIKVYQPEFSQDYLADGVLSVLGHELLWKRETRAIVKVGNEEYYEDDLAKALSSIQPLCQMSGSK